MWHHPVASSQSAAESESGDGESAALWSDSESQDEVQASSLRTQALCYCYCYCRFVWYRHRFMLLIQLILLDINWWVMFTLFFIYMRNCNVVYSPKLCSWSFNIRRLHSIRWLAVTHGPHWTEASGNKTGGVCFMETQVRCDWGNIEALLTWSWLLTLTCRQYIRAGEHTSSWRLSTVHLQQIYVKVRGHIHKASSYTESLQVVNFPLMLRPDPGKDKIYSQSVSDCSGRFNL